MAEVQWDQSGTYKYILDRWGKAWIEEFRDRNKPPQEVLQIPDTLDGHKVIGIGKRAFRFGEALKKIDIPDGVAYLEDSAFQGRLRLEEIHIPDSVKWIGEKALPENDDFVVAASKGSYTAAYCREYGIRVAGDERQRVVEEGIAFNLYPDGTAYVTRCEDAKREMIIPRQCQGHRVVGILPKAFHGCGVLQVIHIPDGEITIGADAFAKCGEKTVTEAVFTDNIPDDIRGMEVYYHSFQQYMVDYGLRDEDLVKRWRTVEKTVYELTAVVEKGSHVQLYCQENGIRIVER